MGSDAPWTEGVSDADLIAKVPPEVLHDRAAGALAGLFLGGAADEQADAVLGATRSVLAPGSEDAEASGGRARGADAAPGYGPGDDLLGTGPLPILDDSFGGPDGIVHAGDVLLGVPVGIATSTEPIDDLVEATVRLVAPDGDAPPLRLAGACAAAMAVSMGLVGATWNRTVALALAAADSGAARGDATPGPSLSARTTWAMALATRTEDDPAVVLEALVGATPIVQEVLPAAFALVALHADDPQRAAEACGRTPSAGPLVGMIVGARAGLGVLDEDTVRRARASAPDLDDLADALLRRR